ncbi:MAG: branched-chain amino acid transport system II carrier protein [Clostridium sp.]|uniref:branched-chain amino acid transport system II carrier protein n=1 Tax=Clostridium sp. TaxID=1506 RepID=UPI002FC78322
MNKRQVLIIGLMTFALFFGAGNVIFPPFIGYESGYNLSYAITGFITTGVLLPLMAVVSASMVNGDLNTLSARGGRLFGRVFPFIIYLAIGPLFIIPRSASVTYTMGVKPLFGDGFSIMLIATLIYFIISGYLALSQSKMVSIIGKVITPLLIVTISMIVIKAIISPVDLLSTPGNDYIENPYFKGFVEGFLTMDALGALVVANILVTTLNGFNITSNRDIVKYSSYAAIIASVLLSIIYAGLSYVGAVYSKSFEFTNGGDLLASATYSMFGNSGAYLLAIVIALACLSTSIGVTSASSRFFSERIGRLSYRAWVIIVTIVSFFISNIGLDAIISITVPVLTIIYPGAIVIIVLGFFSKYLENCKYVYSVGVYTAFIISLINTIDVLSIKIPFITDAIRLLPLYNVSLSWILPTVILTLFSYILGVTIRKIV